MRELIGMMRRGDEQALLYLVNRRHGRLDRAMGVVTHLGGATFTIAATAAMLAAPSPTWSAAGRRAAIALAASHLCVQLLKRSIARARPNLPVGILSLVKAPDRFSFPSGHSAAALSVALGVSLALPAAAPWLLVVAALVGISRSYLGVHYPGDVAVGWALAGAAFLFGAWI
ncbi:MAG: phosphatase PAP2 family protein [Gemmatimonadetes bacterium]|nr:phosphatase PAP2 family protein [Gemmatimonadota bacterium]